MDIDLDVYQGGGHEAWRRVRFCIKCLSAADAFASGVDWGSRLTNRLTVEETIGALVSCFQTMRGEYEGVWEG